MMSLVVCEASGGDARNAMPAAAALELWLAAGDVFDDLEDRDQDSLWQEYGDGQAANTATVLLFLSQTAALRLRRYRSAEIALRAVEELGKAGTTSSVGQYLDLAYELEPNVTEDDYFHMTRLRSGALLECACKLGALLGTGGEEVIQAFGEFGNHLGTYCQVRNDVRSLKDCAIKSDISRRKKTLPILYGLKQAEGHDREYLEKVFRGDRSFPVDRKVEDKVVHILEKVGSISYSLIVADLYKRKSVDALTPLGISGLDIIDHMQTDGRRNGEAR